MINLINKTNKYVNWKLTAKLQWIGMSSHFLIYILADEKMTAYVDAVSCLVKVIATPIRCLNCVWPQWDLGEMALCEVFIHFLYSLHLGRGRMIVSSVFLKWILNVEITSRGWMNTHSYFIFTSFTGLFLHFIFRCGNVSVRGSGNNSTRGVIQYR